MKLRGTMTLDSTIYFTTGSAKFQICAWKACRTIVLFLPFHNLLVFLGLNEKNNINT
jgi:hypothetical protein